MVVAECTYYGLHIRKGALVGKDESGFFAINHFPRRTFIGNRTRIEVYRYTQWGWECEEEYSAMTALAWAVYKEMGQKQPQKTSAEIREEEARQSWADACYCSSHYTGKDRIHKASAQNFRHGFSGWKSDKEYGYNETNRNSYYDFITSRTPEKYMPMGKATK